jgi:hypothetical protein
MEMDHDPPSRRLRACLCRPFPGDRRERAFVTITASTLSSEHSERLSELQRVAQTLLSGLDELGLNQAAAYASMALDVMRQSRPDRLPTG